MICEKDFHETLLINESIIFLEKLSTNCPGVIAFNRKGNWYEALKSTLQELTQKKYRSLPLYKLSDSTHHKEINYFEVLCSIDKTNFEVQGKGNTRKGAELDAAQNMLELIQKDV